MRFNRGGVISEFFSALADGDPIALGTLGFFAVVAAGAGLLVWKVRRDLQREDEADAKKYGRKPPK